MEKVLVVDVIGSSHQISAERVAHAQLVIWLWNVAGGKVTRFSDVATTSIDRTEQRDHGELALLLVVLFMALVARYSSPEG